MWIFESYIGRSKGSHKGVVQGCLFFLHLKNYLINTGVNTPQDTNYTATCLPSRKLYKLDEPDTQDTAGEARTSSSVIYSYGPPHMAKQKQDDQLEHTYNRYVRIWDVTLKTCRRRWMIGRSGERGIPVLAAWLDDDDDIYCYVIIYIYIYIYIYRWKDEWMNVWMCGYLF